MMYQAFRFAPCVVVLAWLLVGVPCPAGHAREEERTASREEELSKLIAVIRDSSLQESDPERVIQAIERLGEMEAVEAVDDLAGLLTFRKWFPWEKDPNQPKVVEGLGITDRQRYPAILALRQIGVPSLHALIKVIETHEPGSLETRNAMEVIIQLSHYDRPPYVRKLKDAAAKASSPEAAERLRKAAEALKGSKR